MDLKRIDSLSPFVSIIVPNYNHAAFLKNRIDSILNQTYQNFEIIILDDHSSDDSLTIINSFRNNPFVKKILINTNNSGSPFKQWNKGFQAARGDIIWIAESDDSCSPLFLETLVNAFCSIPNCTLAYSRSQYINEENEPLPTPIKHSHDKVYHNGKDFIKERLDIGSDIWNASSAIFRRSAIADLPIDYLDFKNAGDHLFWIELIRSANGSVFFLNKALNYFRQHNYNITGRKDLFYNIFYEEHIIYKKQCAYGFIKGLKKYYVLDKYRSMILSKAFINKDDRDKTLVLWGLRSPWSWIPIKILSKLYQMIHFSSLPQFTY